MMLKLIYESNDKHRFEYNTTEMDEEKAKKQVELRLIELGYENYCYEHVETRKIEKEKE